MVDFTKRAARAAGDILSPGETVLAGVNVTDGPFRVAGGGFTGGLIAGGAVGAAVGVVFDRKAEDREAEREDVKPLPAVASRPALEPTVPTNGGLLGVTDRRLLVWSISGMGKAKKLLHDISLMDVDRVVWEDVGSGWLSGRPPSILIWIGIGDRMLPLAAIAMAASGRHARAVIEALADQRPGLVEEFTP